VARFFNYFILSRQFLSDFRLPRRIKTNGVGFKGKIENGLKTQGPN
jgi:hypothetical protein